MAIVYHRDSAQAGRIESPVAVLTQNSPLIKSWHSSLQRFFFNKEGLMVGEVSCFPNLIINYIPLHPRPEIWISIEPSNLGMQHTFCDFKTLINRHIRKLLQLVKENPANSKVVICKRVFGSSVEIMMLEERHFMQLTASLFNLYKDIFKISKCQIEERKLVILQERLENLALTTEETDPLNTLKEMILEMRECHIYKQEYQNKAKLDQIMWQRRLLDELQIKYHFFRENIAISEIKINDNFIAQCSEWLMHLPDKEIVCVCVNSWKKFPRSLLVNVLRARSSRILISILQKNLKIFSVFLPLDLLKKALKDMLINDVKKLWDQFSIKELIVILQEVSENLLDKILAELPYEKVYNLRKEVLSISIEKQIQECFVELKIAYQKKYKALNVHKTVISFLRSLAAGAICKAPHSSVVGLGAQALSSVSLERVLLTSPRLQEEVFDQVRGRINVPITQGSPRFTFSEAQEPAYLPELDLFPLASLVEGYEDVLKETLLEKCVSK
ncbi:hypothetical protein CLAVI_000318 [Candidatus Clavichlamydia salmonicola]|uniref:hypothetical protein n=1 Tax=Candidatus Clavichlamydia salmonicola TaxID=469812 RepID=UPI00189151B6|nr:hypothetical protein [Candidatus Clavichlamydia salmonicola]MBF5050703.1 hypothetical protein [Candidatus Clavichlamydia salmonicola]